MAENQIDSKAVDSVLERAVLTVERCKRQIFDISENARNEAMRLKNELEQVKKQAAEMIAQVDALELKVRLSRRRLAEVSHNLRNYSENDIRRAYEQAAKFQMELNLSREREVYLRNKRDEIERRLRGILDTIEKAETIMTQMGIVLDFLTGEVAQMEEAMETAQNRQLFGLKIIQAQEEERKRVAREIHDGPAQSMANVVVRSEIVEKLMKQNHMQKAEQELAELKEIVRDCLADVRRIIFDLRPMALDDLGLIPTLRKFIEDFQHRYYLNTGLVVNGKEEKLPSSMNVALFRLVQESLMNAAKHAKAKYVEVKIEFSSSSIKLHIKDDGIGYQPETNGNGLHYGIMGMRERTELLEGLMDIYSAPKKGTEVYFYIPFSKDE